MEATSDGIAAPGNEIPGDAGPPLLGYSLHWMRDPRGLIEDRHRRYGDVSWSRSFGARTITMIGADASQLILVNKDKAFSNGGGWDYFIGRLFHRGLMLLDFDEHRYHRRIMQAAFTTKALQQYCEMMNPTIDSLLDQWQANEKFEVYPALKQMTLDIASRVFMGEESGKDAQTIQNAFIDVVRASTALVHLSLPFSRWRRGLKSRQLLENYFRERIPAKRKDESNDMFSRLCHAQDEDGKSFSDDDIVNHMIFLMMAAHDTTTITLSELFFQLAKHPEWQQRLRQEALSVGNRYLDYEQQKAQELHGLAMKESLRLMPPVNSIPRLVLKDFEYKGFHIPKGSKVSVLPCYSHFMEEYWSEPDRFDPMRFSEERREDKSHPYAFTPFGGGAHKCIGLHFAEMLVKTMMHQILQRFSWSVDPAYEMPIDYTSLPVPSDQLPVNLHLIKA